MLDQKAEAPDVELNFEKHLCFCGDEWHYFFLVFVGFEEEPIGVDDVFLDEVNLFLDVL